MTPTEPFSFGPHYSFPPFFTKQPNPLTRSSQYQSWSSLILAYCRHYKIFSLSLADALDTPLFYNQALNRRLSVNDARDLLDWMASSEGGERVEWIGSAGKGKGSGNLDRCWVFWRRPEEWASLIENWVDSTGQKGTVLTLYEIIENQGQEWYGMEIELFQKSLATSVKRGKAQVFGEEGSLAAKFF